MTSPSYLDQFRRAMEHTGIQPPDSIVDDGKLRRFGTNGKGSDDAGWYVLHGDGIPAGAFGCWRSDVSGTFRADIGRVLTTDEQRAHRERMASIQRQREAERERRKVAAADRARQIWDAAAPAPADQPYLVSHGVGPHGLRLYRGELAIGGIACDGALIVPLSNGAGSIQTLEFIADSGDKRYLPGGTTRGVYCGIGEGMEAIVVCEGWATDAAIHEATTIPVRCAMSAGNLHAVSEAARAQARGARIIIAGDHDESGTGQRAAEAAARAVGGVVAIPEKVGIDWCDVRRDQGDEAVRTGIAKAREPDANDATPEPRPWLDEHTPTDEYADVAQVRRERSYADHSRSEQPRDSDPGHIADIGNLKLANLAEIRTGNHAPRLAILTSLLFVGAWLVVGRPKIGKSWLLLQLALAVAEHSAFLGFASAVQGAEALCIFGEDDNPRIRGRLEQLGVVTAPAGCHVVNQQELFELAKRFSALVTFPEFLDHWLAQHPNLRLVIVDTETTVRQVWAGERPADESQRVTESDYQQTRAYDELALRRNVVILLVNHARKQGRRGDLTDIHELINRSNTALAGASGSIALADPPDADPFDPKQRLRVLGIRGRDLKDDILLAVRQREEMPYFVSEGEFSEVRQTEAESEVLTALQALQGDAPEGVYVSIEELAADLDKRRGTVKRTVSRMLEAKRTTWKRFRISTKRGRGGGLRLDPL